jgi:SPP1 gp7 family putative phage head morphogenesis protein
MAIDTWIVPQVKRINEAFWETEREELFSILFPLIKAAAIDGAKSALNDLLELGIGVDWGLVNTAVRDWAKRYTYGLVSGINGTTRNFLQSAIVDWIESGAPLGDLIDQVTPMFGAVRAQMISVTEVTRAFAEGNTATWRESGLVKGQRWMTGEDELVCPTCGALEGQVFDLGDGSHTPPAHVNCRCYLQPVVAGGE